MLAGTVVWAHSASTAAAGGPGGSTASCAGGLVAPAGTGEGVAQEAASAHSANAAAKPRRVLSFLGVFQLVGCIAPPHAVAPPYVGAGPGDPWRRYGKRGYSGVPLISTLFRPAWCSRTMSMHFSTSFLGMVMMSLASHWRYSSGSLTQ